MSDDAGCNACGRPIAVGNLLGVNARSDAVDAARALEAFLRFREADMVLWARAGDRLGLSRTAMLVLSRILRAHAAGAPLRQVDLVRGLQLSAAAISSTVDVLEERGLARREKSPRDRRSAHLVPSHSVGSIESEVLAADASFLERAAALSPEALGGFVALMDHMSDLAGEKYTEPLN